MRYQRLRDQWVVSVVLTLIFRAVQVPDGRDATTASGYGADEHDPRVPTSAEAADLAVGAAGPSVS